MREDEARGKCGVIEEGREYRPSTSRPVGENGNRAAESEGL